MTSSSIDQGRGSQLVKSTDVVESTQDSRAYRRSRRHLYPIKEYRAAKAIGGSVTSYCGLVLQLSKGDPAKVKAATPEPDDCVTCLDVRAKRKWARL